MELKGLLLWLSPLILILITFFTSAIKKHPYERYAVYFVVFLSAFLLDLQALLFPNDLLDAVLSYLVVLVASDFFWRGFRMKNNILRFSALVIALILLTVTYKSWAYAGPNVVQRHYFSKVLVHSRPPVKGFHIKQRTVFTQNIRNQSCLELYKKRSFSLLEQKLSTYVIAEGYENSSFNFRWRYFEHRIAVDAISDTDTLWTLTDPGPPK